MIRTYNSLDSISAMYSSTKDTLDNLVSRTSTAAKIVALGLAIVVGGSLLPGCAEEGNDGNGSSSGENGDSSPPGEPSDQDSDDGASNGPTSELCLSSIPEELQSFIDVYDRKQSFVFPDNRYLIMPQTDLEYLSLKAIYYGDRGGRIGENIVADFELCGDYFILNLSDIQIPNDARLALSYPHPILQSYDAERPLKIIAPEDFEEYMQTPMQEIPLSNLQILEDVNNPFDNPSDFSLYSQIIETELIPLIEENLDDKTICSTVYLGQQSSSFPRSASADTYNDIIRIKSSDVFSSQSSYKQILMHEFQHILERGCFDNYPSGTKSDTFTEGWANTATNLVFGNPYFDTDSVWDWTNFLYEHLHSFTFKSFPKDEHGLASGPNYYVGEAFLRTLFDENPGFFQEYYSKTKELRFLRDNLYQLNGDTELLEFIRSSNITLQGIPIEEWGLLHSEAFNKDTIWYPSPARAVPIDQESSVEDYLSITTNISSSLYDFDVGLVIFDKDDNVLLEQEESNPPYGFFRAYFDVASSIEEAQVIKLRYTSTVHNGEFELDGEIRDNIDTIVQTEETMVNMQDVGAVNADNGSTLSFISPSGESIERTVIDNKYEAVPIEEFGQWAIQFVQNGQLNIINYGISAFGLFNKSIGYDPLSLNVWHEER